MKIFTKKEMDRMRINESQLYKIYEKKELVLHEDNSERVAAVQPTTNGNSSTYSLNSDLADSQRNNPGVNHFEIDGGDYDHKQTNDSVKFNINATNTTDATQEIQNLQKNPQLRNVMNNMDTKFHVHMKENINKLRENSISFSKKEIREILNKK